MQPRVNYIADQNRFGLEAPPVWWLQRLADFDSMLVVIPSRTQPVLRLARRVQRSPGIGPLAVLDRHADTAMLVSYKLVPVTTIIRHGTGWEIESFLQALRDRDIWAHGGAQAVSDRLEKHERDVEVAESARLRDEMDHRSRDAYRSYKARTGQRTRLAETHAVNSQRQFVPSGSTGQASGSRLLVTP